MHHTYDWLTCGNTACTCVIDAQLFILQRKLPWLPVPSSASAVPVPVPCSTKRNQGKVGLSKMTSLISNRTATQQCCAGLCCHSRKHTPTHALCHHPARQLYPPPPVLVCKHLPSIWHRACTCFKRIYIPGINTTCFPPDKGITKLFMMHPR